MWLSSVVPNLKSRVEALQNCGREINRLYRNLDDLRIERPHRDLLHQLEVVLRDWDNLLKQFGRMGSELGLK